jgi:hypothetical protein
MNNYEEAQLRMKALEIAQKCDRFDNLDLNGLLVEAEKIMQWCNGINSLLDYMGHGKVGMQQQA